MSEGLTIRRNPVTGVVRANLGIIIVIAIISAVLSLLTPVFLSPYNLRTVLLEITTNMYIALGMTLVINFGGIDISVGSIVAMSGTLTVGLMALDHLPLWLAVTLGLALGGVDPPHQRVGRRLLQASIVHRHARDAQRCARRRLRLQRRPLDENDGPDVTGVGSGYLSVFPLPVLYMVALIAIFVDLLNRTKFGTYIYAISGNRESARLSGVPIERVEIVTFTISGLLAAFAGLVLSARMFSGQPSVESATNWTRSPHAYWAAPR